jgi:hypothetical protein
MKIAVVGAGVSGLTAAYLLNRAHDVELFERNDYAGGHAHTITVAADGGRRVGLETGFIVYNEHTYPGFTALLRDLRVPTKAGDMSISVRCRACRLEYSSRGVPGMLAQRRNALRPRRAMLAIDILRFYGDTRRILRDGGYEEATLRDLARGRRYSGEFVRHFIVPLAAAVWSTPASGVLEFPARYFLRFLHNHGIIGLQPAFVWRTVQGGSQAYVRAMLDTMPGRTRLQAPVRAVRRDADTATVRLENGDERRFDAVVLACHADDALSLLADASPEEQLALGGFVYTSNRTVLHTDASLLPASERVRASWNYATDDCRDDGSELGMTFHLNRLQALDEPREYCVSLNAREIEPSDVIAEMTYEHPTYTFGTLAAQEAVGRIQGERRTFFAGAHLGYGFHEDGYASGARVAAMLGVEP